MLLSLLTVPPPAGRTGWAQPELALLVRVDGQAVGFFGIALEEPGLSLPDIHDFEKGGIGQKLNELVGARRGRSKFQLQVLPLDDLPIMPDFTADNPTRCTASGSGLKAALTSVAFAISTEETRYYLNGVFIEPGADGALLVATDGHRLAKRWLRIEGVAPDRIILPRKLVTALLAHLPDGDVTLEATDSRISITMPGLRIVSKLIDGTFPDYTRVIPQAGAAKAEFEAKAIRPAVERVIVISSEKGRAIKFKFSDGQLQLSVNNPDAGSAEETIPVEGSLEVEAGFNGKYVLDALTHLGDGPLTLSMETAGSPAILRADGDHEENLIVLMPMRV
ncbi:DNA polymerase III subunit beta [Agrobacterium vitis]|uniref:DNA polymerase III subunit beta n=1 Tax=Agrobacterium vitis TaxID=373 RepID=UPI001F1A4C2B|nr:DNA polymerase III subunit beta [Agrobacterium vitis]MCF1479400.1 DNA polymerase III subunit beta [Agrobacterium vitis]